MIIVADGDERQSLSTEALFLGLLSLLTPEQQTQVINAARVAEAKMGKVEMNVSRVVKPTLVAPDNLHSVAPR